MPLVDFRVVLTGPFEETTMQFHQPCKITISGKRLIFQATMLEKNIGSYFPSTRRVLVADKINDEKETLRLILEHFGNYAPAVCDLNKGVKYLWANNTIDSKYVKYKKNRSTSTEAMDEEYLLKNEYPVIYQDLMKSPLNKTIFKYLLVDEKLSDHFTVDPTNGELSIPLYPKNLNQIQNVINAILSNN